MFVGVGGEGFGEGCSLGKEGRLRVSVFECLDDLYVDMLGTCVART